MNAMSLQNLAISSAKTQKGATSVRVQKDTSCKKMGEAAKILMNVQQSSTTASSFVSTLLGDSLANVLLDSLSTIQPALTTTSVLLRSIFVGQRAFARIHQEVLFVSVNVASHLIKLGRAVKMLMNVMATTGVSMAAKI